MEQGIDYNTLSREQQTDPETDAYKTAVSNLIWEYVPINNTQVLCDVSTGRSRPLVPTTFRRKIFDVVHGLAHPSIRSIIKLIKAKFVWHTMVKDIRDCMARSCDACQRCKVQRHIRTDIGTFPQPQRGFAHIHVDIVGPLPVSNEFRYLFTLRGDSREMEGHHCNHYTIVIV